MTSEERRARILWGLVGEPARAVEISWVAEFGHVDAWRRLLEGCLPKAPPELVAAARAADVDEAQRVARVLSARIVCPGDDEWPARLDDLTSPPHCLWIRGSGHLADLAQRSVSIVGARAATAYGLEQARLLAFGIAAKGYAVVSGAAFGIDAAAHKGALAADGATVAVLACGVDRAYPQAHRGLLDAVMSQGAVVSELPPGASPFAHRFLARNRLIAALTSGTVVVEAGVRSGSRNTALAASALHRHVAAVPGPVTSRVSVGCHELIRDQGAALVTNVADLLALVAPMGEDLPEETRVDDFDADWSAQDRLVYGWVPVRRGASVDEVIRGAGTDPLGVMAALGRLEACGAVRRADGGWQKVPRRTERTPGQARQ